MKKVVIFLGVIITLFVVVSVATKMHQDGKVAGNIYGKTNLHPLTIEQLDDPLYQNIILPASLNKKLKKGGDEFVYFFSPECSFCMKTTPILNPVAEKMNISVFQYNLLEFEEGYKKYDIVSTPTLIHFKDGKEEARIIGLQTKKVFEDFLKGSM